MSSAETFMRQAPDTVEVYMLRLTEILRDRFPDATDKQILEALPGLCIAASIDFGASLIAKRLERHD